MIEIRLMYRVRSRTSKDTQRNAVYNVSKWGTVWPQKKVNFIISENIGEHGENYVCNNPDTERKTPCILLNRI